MYLITIRHRAPAQCIWTKSSESVRIYPEECRKAEYQFFCDGKTHILTLFQQVSDTLFTMAQKTIGARKGSTTFPNKLVNVLTEWHAHYPEGHGAKSCPSSRGQQGAPWEHQEAQVQEQPQQDIVATQVLLVASLPATILEGLKISLQPTSMKTRQTHFILNTTEQ